MEIENHFSPRTVRSLYSSNTHLFLCEFRWLNITRKIRWITTEESKNETSSIPKTVRSLYSSISLWSPKRKIDLQTLLRNALSLKHNVLQLNATFALAEAISTIHIYESAYSMDRHYMNQAFSNGFHRTLHIGDWCIYMVSLLTKLWLQMV